MDRSSLSIALHGLVSKHVCFTTSIAKIYIHIHIQLPGAGKESSVDSDAENEEWTEQTEQEKRKVNNASTSKEFCCDASPR